MSALSEAIICNSTKPKFYSSLLKVFQSSFGSCYCKTLNTFQFARVRVGYVMIAIDQARNKPKLVQTRTKLRS